MSMRMPPSLDYEIGQRLARLREEGALITGSGNVVHNLHTHAWGRHTQEPYDWAISFEKRVRELLLACEHNPLIDYENKLCSEGGLTAPTPRHYLPLLYVIGTRTASEPATFPVDGLYVLDASIITGAVAGNPALSIVSMAARTVKSIA
jgi:4,5-DOPA dioxygenase extradiol